MLIRRLCNRAAGGAPVRSLRRVRAERPRLEPLESRLALSGLLVSGAGPGQSPMVRVSDAETGQQLFQFLAYDARMKAGVRVAVGDVNGDGIQDIVAAAGPQGSSQIKVFSASDGILEGQFSVPRNQARGGLSVAVGDVQNTGTADIVVSSGLGKPLIQVYSGLEGRLVTSFRADAGLSRGAWRGGAKLAVGDLDRDGHADVIAVPTTGRALVSVISGATGAILSSYQAFPGAVARGLSVAVGEINADQRPDVIVAAPASPGSARVRVLDGLTGTVSSAFREAGAGFGRGVQIAALNFGGRADDAIALSATYAPPRQSGGTVFDTRPLRFSGLADPSGEDNRGQSVAYRLAAPGGAFLAGTNTVANSTAAVAVAGGVSPLSLSIPPIERLAIYVPSTGLFEPVVPGDSRLVGKDITVLVHGWAPGYQDWVDYEAKKGIVLKWWQTFPGQPGYDPSHPGTPGPASNWLLQGGPPDTTPAANEGVAQAIAGRLSPTTGGPADLNAVVLAYSWIDDSATSTWEFLDHQIPEDADLSEARTTLNGQRLASALETALGNSTGTAAKIQIAGHSHGSKVATVGAVALSQAGYPLRQLTTLDSPENSFAVVDGAANFNWFFMQNLPLDRQSASAPFVDNYISYFGAPYGGITSTGSYNLSGNLNQVVDTQLNPDSVSFGDLPDEHAYAAWWYGGSSDPNLTYQQTVGQYWSPLLPANGGPSNPVPGLSPYFEQNWGLFSHPANQQFVLDGQSSPGQNFTFASAGVGPVSLQQAATKTQQQTVSLGAPWYGYTGLSFSYQFSSFAPGDLLTILADGTEAFVMDPTLSGVGTQSLQATISLASLPLQSHTLKFILTSAVPNSTSKVTVSNIDDFEQNVL